MLPNRSDEADEKKKNSGNCHVVERKGERGVWQVRELFWGGGNGKTGRSVCLGTENVTLYILVLKKKPHRSAFPTVSFITVITSICHHHRHTQSSPFINIFFQTAQTKKKKKSGNRICNTGHWTRGWRRKDGDEGRRWREVGRSGLGVGRKTEEERERRRRERVKSEPRDTYKST